MSYWDQRRHRDGGDGRSERFESARQRTVILTFDTPEEADAWDEAGQPLSVAPYSNALLPSPALAVVTAQGEACLAVMAEPSTLRDLSDL